MMERLLITGANGFLGKHVVQYWLRNHPEVELYLTDIAGSKKSNIRPVDLTIESEINAYINECRPTQIIHLAGSIGQLTLAEHVNKNILATENLYQSISSLKNYKQIKIIQVSSAAVYGNTNNSNKPIKEANLKNPVSYYGISKLAQQSLSYYYSQSLGLNISIACIFNTIGPNQSRGLVPMDFIYQLKEVVSKKQAAINVGNLNTIRDFIDVRDIAPAFNELLTNGRPGEIYNVANGVAVEIRTVLKILKRISNHEFKVQVINKNSSAIDASCVYADISKIITETNWRPQIDIEQSLCHMWERENEILK